MVPIWTKHTYQASGMGTIIVLNHLKGNMITIQVWLGLFGWSTCFWEAHIFRCQLLVMSHIYWSHHKLWRRIELLRSTYFPMPTACDVTYLLVTSQVMPQNRTCDVSSNCGWHHVQLASGNIWFSKARWPAEEAQLHLNGDHVTLWVVQDDHCHHSWDLVRQFSQYGHHGVCFIHSES